MGGGADARLGVAAMDDRVAVALRGFGPFGILAIVVILAGNLVVVPLSGIEISRKLRPFQIPHEAGRDPPQLIGD